MSKRAEGKHLQRCRCHGAHLGHWHGGGDDGKQLAPSTCSWFPYCGGLPAPALCALLLWHVVAHSLLLCSVCTKQFSGSLQPLRPPRWHWGRASLPGTHTALLGRHLQGPNQFCSLRWLADLNFDQVLHES